MIFDLGPRRGKVLGFQRRVVAVALTCASALCSSPAFAEDDVLPPKMYVTTPGGINVSSGAFVHSVADISIGPLTLERYHMHGLRKGRNPLIGKNMSHNFDIFVAPNYKYLKHAHYPIVHIGSSASGQYAESGGVITYHMRDALKGRLQKSNGNYVYTDSSGTIYTFSSAIPREDVPSNSQSVTSIDFPDGRRQIFSYNANNQLKLVTDTSGWAIVFDYNAAGDVSAACGFNLSQTYVTASSTCTGAALKVTYGYDSNGLLTSVIDVGGQTTTYPGNTTARIPCVQPPGYTSCKVANSTGSGTFFQTMADGAVWQVFASQPETIDIEGYVPGEAENVGWVTDPDGKTTNFVFTRSSLYSMTDPNGKVTQYRFTGAVPYDWTGPTYHEGTFLIEATMPEGGKYLAEYHGPFGSITKETIVAKPGSGLPDLVKEYGYSQSGTIQNAAKPIWIKDPNGNVTDFTYAGHGGVLTEMKPAPSAGAARPLKVYTYVQKYAYIKNASGSLVQAATPIWLLDTETECQTAAGSNTPTCDTNALQVVTKYEYGANGTANNLLLRGKVVDQGTGKLNLRTCYGYDNYGNKIFEIEPRANLSSCS